MVFAQNGLQKLLEDPIGSFYSLLFAFAFVLIVLDLFGPRKGGKDNDKD
jgi:hypothetical protein